MKWYKQGYFWRRKTSDGSDGKGDLIYNTCTKILQDEDMSTWALWAFCYCGVLLKDGKRWPDSLNEGDDAESWLERIIHQRINKLFNKQILPFRYQRRMTRDPYIAFYALAIFLDKPMFIEQTPIKWYCYSLFVSMGEDLYPLLRASPGGFLLLVSGSQSRASIPGSSCFWWSWRCLLWVIPAISLWC